MAATKFILDKGGSTTAKKTTSAGSGQIRYVPANASAAAAAKQNVINKSLATAVLPAAEKGIAIPSYATNSKSITAANKVNASVPKPTKTVTTTPVQTSAPAPSAAAPVQQTPAPAGPVQEMVPQPEAPVEAPAAPEWKLEGDPFYQQALADAQAQFNLERIGAQGAKQYQEVGINRELGDRPATAEAARRRLAGNYAARGMGGGRAGALTRAEAESNARELTARTSLREQLSELNRQFVGQYGAEGSDWTGTLRGQQARNAATNIALQNRLAGVTTVG